MMEVTFHNRGLEIKEIMDILGMKTRLITFMGLWYLALQ